MTLMEIMRHRRSVRKYTEDEVKDSDIDMILDAALTSASGHGKRPWSFIVVKDKEMLKKLSESRLEGSAKMLANAQCAVVVVGNTELSDTWVEDCSIALTNMQLMTDSLGLGSCWVQIRMRRHSEEISADDYVRDLLGIPDPYRVQSILSIGVPAVHPGERAGYDKDKNEKIHYNAW